VSVLTVKVKRLHPDARLPTKAFIHDAGFDLYAVGTAEGLDHVLVRTGVALEIPPGWYGQIVGRSGFAVRGYGVLGGCLDSGFRGEVMVILGTPDGGLVTVRTGDRVAQLVILPVPVVEMVEADELGPSARGEGGLGSTGR
jgi:dUTP pyrophosphatase